MVLKPFFNKYTIVLHFQCQGQKNINMGLSDNLQDFSENFSANIQNNPNSVQNVLKECLSHNLMSMKFKVLPAEKRTSRLLFNAVLFNLLSC
jgi:SAM-dependent MidA family methyltransferase